MRRDPRLNFSCFLATLLSLGAAAEPKNPATSPQVITAAEKEGKVVIYSTTDSAAAAPLLKDFGALYPKVTVEYNDMNSTEV